MAGQTYETNKKMKPYFTYEQLEQATCEGKQAFNSGLPIVCPYIGEDSIPLRIRWLSGYDSARKTSIRAMDYGDGYGSDD